MLRPGRRGPGPATAAGPGPCCGRMATAGWLWGRGLPGAGGPGRASAALADPPGSGRQGCELLQERAGEVVRPAVTAPAGSWEGGGPGEGVRHRFTKLVGARRAAAEEEDRR